MSGCAWVTLATNDSYSLGALVLAHSLRKSNTVHKLAVLITPAVSQAMRGQLETVYDLVKVVDVLDSKDEAHLALMKRPELGITFTKIHCWRLTEFVKCVFLDADTLVVRNCDELFEREEFSAAPDVSWPDCFNSGVFVYKPSVETFNKLLQFAVEKGSFDGGDQGLLNQFFSDWATEDIKKHLPFVYNLTTVAAYSYVPAFKQYGSETRIVHFIGTGKPWLQQLDPATKKITPTSGSEHLTPLLQQWWDLFCEKVHPNLDKSLEIANGMSHPSVEACSNSIGVECNDEPEPPCLLEPQTAYREKNDFRQINLPYQPFDVKDSSGELLNVKFFTASVVPSPPPSPSPTTMTNPNEHREEQQREWREWEKEEEKRNSEGDNEEKEIAECGEISENGNQFQKPDGGGTNDDQHVEKDEKEEKGEEKTLEEAPKGPFDYNSFFPDETCIDNYLQQNVATYQPFGSPRHEHNESNHNRSYEGSNGDINGESNVDQDNQNIPPSLPRFLTIPEDDQRQRGNEERCFSEEREFKHVEETVVHRPPQQPKDEYKQSFAISTNEIPQRVETFVEKRELHKSKSMSHLAADANTPDASPKGSIWKSQPSVNTDPNKKYSMPKLKPILPRQNSKSVLPSIPKVTLYTEFLMSSEYKVPEDLPKDKVGFVESHLRNSKDSHLKRSKSDADIGKFGPLPYAFTSEVDKTTVPKQKTLFRRLDNDPELYDLSQCKRQQGNKPKPKESKEKKENNGVLPALKPLKPLIPSKDKKSVKKRKSNELSLSPGDEERGKKPKQESRRVKERKKPTKPSSVCSKKTVNRNADSVDDILKRLYNFSKDYQHYFGDIRFKTTSGDKTESRTKENENVFETTEAKKKETYKNANVQVPDTSPNSSEREQDSKTFEKVKLLTSTVSEGTQTTKETHSNGALREGGKPKDLERSEESKETRKTNSKAGFKKFRSYLKDQTETTLKGLLDIPKIMSDSNGNDDEPRSRKSNAIVGMSSLDVVKTFGTYKPDEVSTKPGVSENKKDIKPESFPQAMREGANGLESKEDDSKVSSLADTIKEGSPTTKDEVVLFVDERKEQSTSESVTTSSRSSAPTSKDLAQPEDDTSEERTNEAKSKPIDTEAKPEQIEGIKQTDGSKDSKEEASVDSKTVNGDNCKREDVRVVRAAPKVVEMSKSQEEGKVGVINGRSQSNLEKESDKTEKKILKNGKVMTSKFGDDFPDQVDGIEGSSQTNLGNGGGLESHDPNPKVKENKMIEKIKKLETKHSNKPEPLCVPDFDTPRTSRVWLEAPTSTEKHSQVTEIVEEIVTKATTSVVHAEAKPSSSSMHPPKSSLVPRTSKSVTSPSRKSKSSPGQSKNRSPRNPIANGTKSPETKRQNGVSSKFQIFADNSPDETSSLVDKNMAAKNRPPTYPSAKYSLSPANNVDGSDCSNNGQESSATLEDRRWASGIAGAIAQLNIESGGEGTKQQTEAGSAAYQEYLRRQNWETGNMDYMGRDSFDNIWSKICQTLEGKMLESLGGSSEAPSLDNSVPTQTIAPQGIVEQPGKEQPLAQIAGSEPTTTTTTTTAASAAAAAAATPMEVKKDENVTVPEVPEYMETLPGSEMSRGPAEEDEIIFTKPENRQTCLTNIVEEEEASDMSSKITGDAVSQEGLVKLSDILKSGQSPAGDDKKSWALVKRPDADKLQVVEVPKKPEDANETSKSKLSKVASRKEAQKSQDVQKEAIPLPDVPGRDGPEPPKREEGAPVSPVQEAQEAIEALPEEQPTETQSGTESSNGKQKKGVFSKILEMVGVSSKDKKGNEPEVSKSVFYDVEGAAASKGQTSEDLSAPKVPESEKPTPEAKGTTETKQEAPVVAPPAVETAKKEVPPEKSVPVAEIKPQQDEKPQQPSAIQKEEKGEQKPEHKIEGQKPETTSAQPQAPKPETASVQPQEPDTTQKGKGIPKPARNSKPSEKKPEEPKPADPAVPSQPTGLSVDPTQKPEIIFTMPTPPVLPDVPTPSGDSASAIVQPTPPEVKGIDAKGKVMTEIDEILGKAKSEVESRLQEVDRKSAEKEEKSSETVEENVKDLINTMKLIVGDDQKVEEPPQSVEDKKSGEVPEPTVPQPPTTTETKSGGGKQPAKQPQGKKPQKGPQKKKEEIEELKVTTEEERKKHKAQATSSKLSDQILKAIPPPRRKTISESKAESSSSSGAIPKTPLEAAAAAATEAGQSKDIISDKPAEAPPSTSGPEPKSSKPSSIPVPPPRNKPKPGQPTSQQKGKTKK